MKASEPLEYWNVGFEPTWMASFTAPLMSEIVNKNPALFVLGLMAVRMENCFGSRRRNTLDSGACSSAEGSRLNAAGRPSTRVTPRGRARTSNASNKSLVPETTVLVT